MTHKKREEVPWVDKYRPKKLKDVVYQNEVISMLSRIVADGNLPHLLFYGQAGTGKTSSILAIAMELYGPTVFRDRVKELNASDERGINIVRTKIIDFAKIAVGPSDSKYPCPPYKIIILDEADAMTTEAQSALRKTIEEYSKVTRFCFICNYINQIIEPIASRCVKIRFKPIITNYMTPKLKEIANNEKLTINDDAVDLISTISNGDMRKGIMLLQNLQYVNKPITKKEIYDIANCISIEDIYHIIDKCINAQNIKDIQKLADDIHSRGLPIYQLITKINDQIVTSDKFDDIQKSNICLYLSVVDKMLINGADEYLQFLSVMTKIKHVYQKK